MDKNACSFCVFWLMLNIVPMNGFNISYLEFTRNTYPNPQLNPGLCGRNETSYVCDPGNHINSDTENYLDQAIQRASQKRYCLCNNQIADVDCEDFYKMAVAVVPRITLNQGFTVSPTEEKEIALYLRLVSWNFGSCDEDLVLVISVYNKQVYTSVGTKLQHLLTDECVRQIYEEEIFNIKEGHFDEGVKRFVTKYKEVLEGDNKCLISPEIHTEYTGNNVALVLIVVGSIVGLVVLAAAIGLIILCVVLSARSRSLRTGTSSGGVVFTSQGGQVATGGGNTVFGFDGGCSSGQNGGHSGAGGCD